MRCSLEAKRFADLSGKIHIYCPYRHKTNICVHVVIKGGYCYRSNECLVLECKFNRLQGDLRSVLSLTW